MHTSTKVVVGLIRHGYLKTEMIISPLNRCPVRVIRQENFDEFQLTYVSLFEAMKSSGVHFRKIQKRLSSIGIEPRIKGEDVGAAFYLRSDLLYL